MASQQLVQQRLPSLQRECVMETHLRNLLAGATCTSSSTTNPLDMTTKQKMQFLLHGEERQIKLSEALNAAGITQAYGLIRYSLNTHHSCDAISSIAATADLARWPVCNNSSNNRTPVNKRDAYRS